MDDERLAHFLEDFMRLNRLLPRITRNTDIESLSLPHDIGKCSHRFCQRCIWVEQSETREALVATRQQIFPAPKISVGTRPHFVTGLTRNNDFVPIS